MIDLRCSLIIEATSDPSFFGFYSPDLEGFTGVGHSIEDCLYQAKWGMEEHVALLAAQKMQIPEANPNPTVVVQNGANLGHPRSLLRIIRLKLRSRKSLVHVTGDGCRLRLQLSSPIC
jgi:predicted RNase H-like HicB family nuclease